MSRSTQIIFNTGSFDLDGLLGGGPASKWKRAWASALCANLPLVGSPAAIGGCSQPTAQRRRVVVEIFDKSVSSTDLFAVPLVVIIISTTEHCS